MFASASVGLVILAGFNVSVEIDAHVAMLSLSDDAPTLADLDALYKSISGN